MDARELFPHLIPPILESRLRDGIEQMIRMGADGAEAFVSIAHRRKAKVQNGLLESFTTSKRGGIGVRVLRAGKVGLATTTDLAQTDFKALFARAFSLAEAGDPDPWLRQASPKGIDDLPCRFVPEVESLTPEARIAHAHALEREARRVSPHVCAIREASWQDGTGATLLLTQTGVRAADLASSCTATLDLAVESEGDRQAGWHGESARTPQALDLTRIAQGATSHALRKLNPSPLPAGTYPVVLTAEVSRELLGVVAGMLSAEAVLKRRSLFGDKFDQPIASPLLTLVDDGRLREGLASAPWDGEGIPTQRNLLIEQGVLRTWLHTLRTAAEMGQSATGTAGRAVGGNPHATTSNLFPLPGAHSQTHLLRMAGEGVMVTELLGLHTVNPVSGELSLGASGVRIRQGELAESVDRMTLSGHLQHFLARVVGLGNDLTWLGSRAGVSMLLEEARLGGC